MSARHYVFVLPFAVAATTAGAYAAMFPPVGAATLAFVFAVPYVFWCSSGRATFRQALWASIAGGFAAWLFLISWLRHAPHALDWHPVSATALGWLITVALAAALSAFWVAWALLAWWMVPRWIGRGALIRFAGLFGLAGAWVMLEWVRSWILTGWPWLPLAASQWGAPAILQALPYTGAYGLSFVIIFFNIAIAVYLNRMFLAQKRAHWWQRLCPEFYAAMLLLLANFSLMYGLGPIASAREPLFNAGLVQPYVPQHEKWDSERAQSILTILENLSTSSAKAGAEVLFWPEAVTPWPVKGHAHARLWAEDLSNRLGVPIIMGNTAAEGDIRDPDTAWYNAVFLVRPDAGLLDRQYYAKRKLVPFGEYVPLSDWLPFIEQMVPIGGSWNTGDRPEILPLIVPNGIISVGPLICSEDLFPGLARESVKAGAGILFVATNNAWFGEEGASVQHAAHSVLRAVETRRPIVRVGNGGWSGWIDEFGAVRAVLSDPDNGVHFRGFEVVPVSRATALIGHRTVYVRYGDWFVGLSSILLIVALIVIRYTARAQRML